MAEPFGLTELDEGNKADESVLAISRAASRLWVLNRVQHELRDLPGEELNRRLNLAGLRTSLSGTPDKGGVWSSELRRLRQTDLRCFSVPVFHLEALGVRRIDQVRLSVPSDWGPRHPLYRRAASMAVKAIYALGLDYGEVQISCDSSGRLSISGLALRPHGSSSLLWKEAELSFRQKAAEAAVSDQASMAEEGRLLIGADPEFVLLLPDGRIAPADRYLRQGDAAGPDSLRVGGKLRYPVAELRPDPAASPGRLVQNIRQLLLKVSRQTEGARLRWAAGGMPVAGVPLGGHIHLSGIWLNARLLRTLDSCLAIPLAAVEGEAGLGRRPRYGVLGDFRHQPHGGFEYRTPPSWLVSPAAAGAVFALALLAARDYRDLPVLPGENPCVREAYYTGNREVLIQAANEVFRVIRSAPSYSGLSGWIEPLALAVSRKATWGEGRDIRVKWKIPVPL
ncbi:putative amidoligase domain-containing protein [Paenibacillus tarimensis]|uniref:putative amidoligase domain-containing protein n=1 Tax=Paenibacillus tarimensis TaxID=416012 RepID=UPI001F3CD9C0|nr:hypothetical protein [Paenibacillus tarimensis]MCF2942650.1 hypothetical protein [Paenibacillus tarimensis]